MSGPGAGWYWRFNMGGSGHYVQGATPDQGSLWVATAPSPCGRAQATTSRYRGTVLANPTARPVYREHACPTCLRYCQRHGLPMPPPLDGAILARLTTIGYDLDGATRLLADLRQHGLDLALRDV